MRNKHYIYIIEDYQWKDGSIGKVGVTQNPERRAKEYKLESLTILEEHTNAKVASKREIELQKQYGFKVDTREYWKTLKMQKKSYTTEAKKKRLAKMDWVAYSNKMDYNKLAQINSVKRKLPISQYDLEGNFIQKWDSALDAAINLFNKKNYQSDITGCCKGRLKTAYKFIWKYAN